MTERSSTGTAELLPCPFCGAADPQFLCGGPGNWYIRCMGCGAATDDVMRHRALELWNARVPAQGSPEPGFLQDDLREMLQALGLFDGARPQSPHEVFQECIAEVRRLKASAQLQPESDQQGRK